MKPLQEFFIHARHKHELVKRSGDIAIYRRWSIDTEWGDGPNPHFEVIRVKRQKASTKLIGGRNVTFEAKEMYPNTNEWGVHGWTFMTFDRAEKKFHSLIEERKAA